LSQKSKRVKNKDKKHISEIALGEFAAAFAFVLFSMVFSSVSAQTSAPIPTLPVNGHTTLQTARPDTSLLNPNYSLSDHLSWNPISNAQALYNYASWSIAGTYSDNVNGTDYTFKKLPNDGVQAQSTDPYGNTITAARNNWDDGSSTLTSAISSSGNMYATTYYQDTSKLETYTSKDNGGDAFSKATNSNGSILATVDSQTGFTRRETYDPEGNLTATSFLSPGAILPDNSTIGYLQIDPLADEKWVVTPVTKDANGNPKEAGSPWIAQKDENGQWQLEKTDAALSGIVVKPGVPGLTADEQNGATWTPDSTTQYSGLKAGSPDVIPNTPNSPQTEGNPNPNYDPSLPFQPGESSGQTMKNETTIVEGRQQNISYQQPSSSGAQADFNKWVGDQSDKAASGNQPPAQENTSQTEAQIAAENSQLAEENNKKAEEANQSIAEQNNYKPSVRDNNQEDSQEDTSTGKQENNQATVNNNQPPAQENTPQNNSSYDANAVMENFSTVQFDTPPAEISQPDYNDNSSYQDNSSGGYDSGSSNSGDNSDDSGW